MLEEKNIGKPYAGEPRVRFDEGGKVSVSICYIRHLSSTLILYSIKSLFILLLC